MSRKDLCWMVLSLAAGLPLLGCGVDSIECSGDRHVDDDGVCVAGSNPSLEADGGTEASSCTSHADCPTETPHCGAEGACTSCSEDSQCEARGLARCLDDGSCGECMNDLDCSEDAPICGEDHACSPCTEDAQCQSVGFGLCNIDAGTCGNECEANSDCADPAAAVCGSENACVPCESDEPCQEDGFDACSADGLCLITLKTLTHSIGELDPPFEPTITSYTLRIPYWASSVAFTPASDHTIQLGDAAAQSGVASSDIPVSANEPTTLDVSVSGDGDRTTSYQITLDRSIDTSYLKDSTPLSGMGRVLAVDGMLLAAGAPDSRTVSVFARAEEGWHREAQLSKGTGNNRFGASVALLEETLAVGAPDDQGDNSGAVFIFSRQETTWRFERTVRPGGSMGDEPNRGFGTTVHLTADGLTVGSATGSLGKMYPVEVFSRSNWNSVTALSEPDAGPESVRVPGTSTGAWTVDNLYEFGSGFGASLALQKGLLVIGAPDHHGGSGGISPNLIHGCTSPFGGGTNCALSSGAVFVFQQSDGAWKLQTSIKSKRLKSYNRFGESVAISDDNLFIGEPWATCDGTKTGAVHVYNTAGGQWTFSETLCSPVASSIQFGASLSVDGDVLAIGAYKESSSSPGFDGSLQPSCSDDDDCISDSGAVFLYHRNQAHWELASHVKATPPHAETRFGRAVVVTSEGLLVGAEGDSSVWVFSQ